MAKTRPQGQARKSGSKAQPLTPKSAAPVQGNIKDEQAEPVSETSPETSESVVSEDTAQDTQEQGEPQEGSQGDGEEPGEGDDQEDQDGTGNAPGSTDSPQPSVTAPGTPVPAQDVPTGNPAVVGIERAREIGRKQVTPPKGRIIRYGEPLTVEGRDDGSSIIVDEDTYQEIFVNRSSRPTYLLKYRKGSRVARTSMRLITQK